MFTHLTREQSKLLQDRGSRRRSAVKCSAAALSIAFAALSVTGAAQAAAAETVDTGASTQVTTVDWASNAPLQNALNSVRLPVVPEVFGPAKWSHEFEMDVPTNYSQLVFLPDRLVSISISQTTLNASAVDANGKEVWTYARDFSEEGKNPPNESQLFRAGTDYFGWRYQETPKPTGLEIVKPVEMATVVSMITGKVVASGPIDQALGKIGMATLRSNNRQMIQVVEKDSYFAGVDTSDFLVMDPRLGVVWVYSPGKDHVYLADLKTGKVITPPEALPCQVMNEAGVSLWGSASIPAPTSVISRLIATSPNGKYGVFGPFRYTRSGATCISGNAGQRHAVFSAIDDNGTAYGYPAFNTPPGTYEFVVAPLNGAARLITLPDKNQKLYWVGGFMKGNIAIHTDLETPHPNPSSGIRTVTGNSLARR